MDAYLNVNKSGVIMRFSLRMFMKNFFGKLFSQLRAPVKGEYRTDLQHAAQTRTDEEGDSHPRSEEFLKSVAEAVPDLLLVYDIPSRTCVYINQHVSAALGFSWQEVEQMRGSFFERVFHPEDLASFLNSFIGFARLVDREVREMEYRFRHLNGEWYWFQCRTTVFTRDHNGYPRQVLCAARNITEHRKYEEAVREGEVLAAMNRFAARLAHDINNPLTNIKNALFLLRNALLLDHPDAKYLQWSEEEVVRITQIVQRISTPSQAEL